MTYDEIPQVMRHALGTFSMFRSIGYPADDIYIVLARSLKVAKGQIGVFVVLKQIVGGKPREFSVIVGGWPGGKKSSDEFEKRWAEVLGAVKNGSVTKADGDRMFQECEARQNVAEFMLALTTKGMLRVRKDMPEAFDALCLFCGRGVRINMGPKAGVAHQEPTCSKFDELPPDQFMKAMNEELAKARIKNLS